MFWKRILVWILQTQLTEFARSHCVDQSRAFPLLEKCVKSLHGGGMKYPRKDSN